MAFASAILNNRNALAGLIAIGLVASTAHFASAQDQLTTVINGVQKASFSITSAKGNVKVHEWRKIRNEVFESEINYKLAVDRRDNYRCESVRVGTKKPAGPEAWNTHSAELKAATKSLTLYSSYNHYCSATVCCSG